MGRNYFITAYRQCDGAGSVPATITEQRGEIVFRPGKAGFPTRVKSRGRGVCGNCGCDAALKADGTLAKHRYEAGVVNVTTGKLI